jgi:hypothetical protein
MTLRMKFPGALAAAALALGALGCSSKSASPPTAFGVNITVDAHLLTADQRSKVSVGYLQVSGAVSEAKTLSIATAIGSGELRFQYLPTTPKAGDQLSFHFEALSAAGDAYGKGDAGPVTLTTGAVAVTIQLQPEAGSGKGQGAQCSADGECASGFCTDGVCCNEACHDLCAACNVAGAKGICTAYAAGTDPDRECGGLPPPGTGGAGGKGGTAGQGGQGGQGGKGGKGGAAGGPDGGSADAGEPLNPPDGGIVEMPAKCGGTCNGQRGCAFAKQGTVCGSPFCNSHRDLASLTCDGQGACSVSLETCSGGFGCDLVASPAMCRTSCTLDAECQSGFYCASGQCTMQKAVGKTCGKDGECGSGHCANSVCCKTACNAPNACNNSGFEGTCQCPGMPCASGVSCTLFYPDVDVDGFGDKSATGVAGCADTPPKGYVADNTDCDDHDANAFPGQTAFFSTTSAGVHTWDYNCDGMMEKGLPEYPGAVCTFCPSACSGNGCSDPTASTCGSANTTASLACAREGGICPIVLNPQTVMSGAEVAIAVVSPPIIIQLNACCGCNDHAGFTTTVGCGISSDKYTTCGTCSAAMGTVGSGTATTTATKVQTCH